MYGFLIVSSLLLAGVLGAAAQRASICTVKAVSEVLTSGRAYMLAGIGRTVLWAAVAGGALSLAFGDMFPASSAVYKLTWLTIAGGAIFGVGAVVNRGCAFSTLSHLASGRIVVVLSLVGMTTGSMAYRLIADGSGMAAGPEISHPLAELRGVFGGIAIASLIAWMIFEVRRLFQRERSPQVYGNDATSPGNIRVRAMRLSTAAALIGTSNALIFSLFGPWAYTQTIGTEVRALAGDGKGPEPVLWLLFGAVAIGAMLQAVLSGNYRLDVRLLGWKGRLLGGCLMGFGAAMIPGGNDALIFYAIPVLSPHAIPAFGAMIIAIAGMLRLAKSLGRSIPVIDCTGDVCRDVEPPPPSPLTVSAIRHNGGHEL